MEESKTNLINDLYSLRAGLSAISKERDNLRKCCIAVNQESVRKTREEYNRYIRKFVRTHDASNSKEINDHITNVKLGAGYTYNDDGTKKANYSNEDYEQAYQLQTFTQKYEETKEGRREELKYGVVGILFALATIAKIIVAVIYSVLNELVGMKIFSVLSGLCGISSIICILNWVLVKRENKCNHEKEMIALYPKWKLNVGLIFSRIDAQMSAKLQERIAPIIKKGYSLYVALQEKFKDLIDVRDWEHLDLIIFYLETGRADTKKEALQLVEREIQTNRIVNAINTATQQICNTIDRMAQQVGARLDTLSSQLTLIAVQRHMHIEQAGRLITATEMQNALLEKAETSAEKLIEEAEYIKKICD